MEHNEAWRGQIIYLSEKITYREELASKLKISLDALTNLIKNALTQEKYTPRLLTMQSIARLYEKESR